MKSELEFQESFPHGVMSCAICLWGSRLQRWTQPYCQITLTRNGLIVQSNGRRFDWPLHSYLFQFAQVQATGPQNYMIENILLSRDFSLAFWYIRDTQTYIRVSRGWRFPMEGRMEIPRHKWSKFKQLQVARISPRWESRQQEGSKVILHKKRYNKWEEQALLASRLVIVKGRHVISFVCNSLFLI